MKAKSPSPSPWDRLYSGTGTQTRPRSATGQSNQRATVAQRFKDLSRFLRDVHSELTPTERTVWLAVFTFSTNGRATVTQTAETLTVQRVIGGDTVTLTYKLDGGDSRNILPTGDGRQIDALSTVKWDGPSLTIVSKREADGRLLETTETWTVNGNTLTAVTAGGPTARKTRLYKR